MLQHSELPGALGPESHGHHGPSILGRRRIGYELTLLAVGTEDIKTLPPTVPVKQLVGLLQDTQRSPSPDCR